MISPMMMVLALQLLRVFQSFETEYLLGMPFGFFVYSTKIFALVRNQIPNYGEATVLASITLLMIVLIITGVQCIESLTRRSMGMSGSCFFLDR